MAKGKYEDIVTDEFRVAFPAVFTPETNVKTGKETYCVTMLVEKTSPFVAVLKGMRNKAATAKWGTDLPAGMKGGIRDTLKPNENGKVPATDWGLGDCYMIKLQTKFKVDICDIRGQSIIDPDKFYGGCYARAEIHTFVYDETGNKGVGFGFTSLFKSKEGERMAGGRAEAATVFAEFIEGGADAGADNPANYEGGASDAMFDD